MRKITLIATLLLLVGCTDGDGARRTAEAHGLSHVKVTGYRFFGCGRDDNQHTGFTAVAPNGRPVAGVVCSSWGLFGKSFTLRLD